MLLFSKSKMAEVFFSQSGAELSIQDGGTHANNSQPCWKTALLPRQGTWIGLTYFHGDTINKSQ